MPCVRHCLVSAQRAAQLRGESIATSCCSAAQPERSGCSTGRCSLPASQLAGFRQHNGYGTASSLPKRAHVRAAACSATQPCHRGPWQRCRAELPTASSAGVCRCTHTHAHTPAHVLCLTRAGACCALGPAASRRAAPQQSERNSASLGSPQVEVLGLNQLGEGEMLLCIGCLLRHQSDPAGSVTCHSSSKGSEQPFHQGDEGKHSSSKAQHHPGRFAGPHPAHPGFL